METKKEKVTKENFEELLLKSVKEVQEFIQGKRSLKVTHASSDEDDPKSEEDNGTQE